MYSITASRCFAPREMQTNVLSTMILDSRQSDKELRCLQYANFTRFYRLCSSIGIREERYRSDSILIPQKTNRNIISFIIYYLLFYLYYIVYSKYHFSFILNETNLIHLNILNIYYFIFHNYYILYSIFIYKIRFRVLLKILEIIFLCKNFDDRKFRTHFLK